MKKTLLILFVIIVIIGLFIGGYYILRKKQNNNIAEASTNNIQDKKYTMENIYNYTSTIESSISDIHNYIMANDTKLLNYSINELNIAMEEFSNYDNYIKSLNDSKYNKLKQYWLDYSEEVNNLYAKIKNKNYTTKDGIISNDRLSTFTYYLAQETYKLK